VTNEDTGPVNTPGWLGGAGLSIWNAKLHAQRFLLVVTGVALTLLVTAQVFSRYVMGISVLGIEELACFSAVWLYFLGSSHGAWERGHISANLVEILAPNGKIGAGIKVIASILTVVIAAWMAVWAWQYFAFSLRRGSTSPDTGIVLAWVHVIMPICLTLMTLYWVVEAGSAIRSFLSVDRSK
jgi:TRAP-type C4-dicarboxylate transport system permease small subunit